MKEMSWDTSETTARRLQRLGLFLLPPLLGLLALVSEMMFAVWVCRMLLLVLMGAFFWDGLRGWRWPGRWLLWLGVYYLLLCAGGWLLGLSWPEGLSWLRLAVAVGELAAGIPVLWPLVITMEIQGFPYRDIVLLPSLLVVWLGLLTAWQAGWWFGKLHRAGREERI